MSTRKPKIDLHRTADLKRLRLVEKQPARPSRLPKVNDQDQAPPRFRQPRNRP